MSKTYTQEQLDIEILKSKQTGIEKLFETLHDDMVSIRSEMKSQFYFNTGLSLGIYGLIAGTALGKLIGAF